MEDDDIDKEIDESYKNSSLLFSVHKREEENTSLKLSSLFRFGKK